jgi:GTP 3',8-cyclase
MSEPLVDTFGRVHRDLRVSLTDRCNLRCTYCMPNDFADWLPGPELLTTDELMLVLDVATSLGIDGVRLTGGEPLLRADVVDVVRRINELPRPPEISVTTNGLKLTSLAQPLRDAGLRRVNVSLDTLDRARFKALTFRDRHDDVLAGIRAAQAAGLAPVKVNAVLMRGVNDDEAPALLRRALDEGWRLRFIEQMPLDPSGIWLRSTMVTADDVFAALSEHYTLTPVPARGSAPAEEFYVDGGPATVGIIASVTRPFCAACDRLRLTADGQLRNCLFARDELDLRAALRDEALDDDARRAEVERRLRLVVHDKLPGHGINDLNFIQPTRPMSAIGG